MKKGMIILFIIGILFIILLANNVKRIDRDNRSMQVDWDSYTCTYE